MHVLHVHAQTEQLQTLDSQLQNLVTKRRELEKSWSSHAWSNLSPGTVEKKLEEVRTTLQTDPFLQQIHTANKDVMSKTAEIDTVNQDLESMKPKQTTFGAVLAEHIARKNKNDEQVCQPT